MCAEYECKCDCDIVKDVKFWSVGAIPYCLGYAVCCPCYTFSLPFVGGVLLCEYCFRHREADGAVSVEQQPLIRS